MAICNLFNDLTNKTGTFLMFSQYAEDLTKHQAQGSNYNVSPSRYLACQIPFSKLGGDLNDLVPKFFQNNFENGCSILRERDDWKPEFSSNIFWNALKNKGLISILNDSDIKTYVNEVKYIGDINIHSYDEKTGMGYSEIYIYLPNQASEHRYGVDWGDKIEYVDSDKNLHGWMDEPISPTKYYYSNGPQWNNKNEVTGKNQFDINAIIVLYDVLNADGSIIHEGIPMGIYFPGIFSATEMQNQITKYSSNSEIYGSGTSYGVRICTRFAVTNIQDTIGTVVEGGGDDALLCQVLAKMGENLELMKEISKSDESDLTTLQALKDTYNMFQNSQTNVPYIVRVNGIPYWFVNGKNTGIMIPDGQIYKECTDEEIEYIIDTLDTIYSYNFKLYPCDSSGIEDKYDNYDARYNKTLYISSSLKNELNEDRTVIGYEILDANKNPYITKNQDPISLNVGEYYIKGILNVDGVEYTVPETYIPYTVERYYPIYTGVVTDEDLKNSNMFNNNYARVSKLSYNRLKINTGAPAVSDTNPGWKLFYAFPASFEPPTRVINRAGMDDIYDDFTRDNVQVDGIEYKLWYTTNDIPVNTKIVIDFTNELGEIEIEIE